MAWLTAIAEHKEFDRVIEFLKENGRFVRIEHKQSCWYDDQGSLVVEKYDGYVLIKKRSEGEISEEVEVKCKEEDYEKIRELFRALDYRQSVVWNRERHLYDWWPVMVFVDKIAEFGVVVSMKLYGQLKDKDKAVVEAKEKFSKLGLNIIDEEEFKQKEIEFIKNWS